MVVGFFAQKQVSHAHKPNKYEENLVCPKQTCLSLFLCPLWWVVVKGGEKDLLGEKKCMHGDGLGSTLQLLFSHKKKKVLILP